MQLNYRASESDTYPVIVDETSSPTTVYIRKDIVPVERIDGDGSTRTVYQYQEAKLSKADYAIYLAEHNMANIDYIAMMTEVDL